MGDDQDKKLGRVISFIFFSKCPLLLKLLWLYFVALPITGKMRESPGNPRGGQKRK